MNVYDAGRMADVMAAEGYVRTDSADAAEVAILNTCHIRGEGGREALFRPWPDARPIPPARAQRGGRRPGDRGGRLRGPGRGRGNHAPRALGRCRDRPADLSPPARPRAPRAGRRARSARYRFPPRVEIRPASRSGGEPGAGGVPDDPGGLRQVLLVLRRPLHQGRRVFAPRPRGPGGGGTPDRARRARDRPARAERQRLSRRRPPRRRGMGARPADPRTRRAPRARADPATPPPTRATWTRI